MSPLDWLRSGRITVQVTTLVITTGLLAMSVIAFVLLSVPDEQASHPHPNRIATQVGSIVRALDALPPSGRGELAAAYQEGDITIDFPHQEDQGAAAPPAPPHSLGWLIDRELPSGRRVTSVIERPDQRTSVTTRLSDGTPVRFNLRLGPPFPGPLPLLPPLLFLAAISISLFIWTAVRVVKPLSRFSAAVEKFGLEGQVEPLPEQGPAEIKLATAAFNRMSDRISRLIDDRTQMMMAISHDLRTPLTRLRLRAEEVTGEDAKRGILRDIELMESSISEAVTSLRHVSAREDRVRADLPSLLESICSDFADAGYAIEYFGPARLAATVRPNALTRAVTNLVQNASKFGKQIAVRLQHDGMTAVIDVEDDGPGVRDSEKLAVLQPFYRSDPARRDPGGFGLGLAIAFEVARDHGGILTLHDLEPRGLRARIRLRIEPA
jgi:signal transduction histidine kinase